MFAYKADVIKNQKFDIGRTINPFKCDCEKCDFLHCPKNNYAVKTKPHKYKVSEFCELWHDELIKYEESYKHCSTPEKILENVKYDVACAMIINTDRIPIIIQAAEKVLQEKFPDFEGMIDT